MVSPSEVSLSDPAVTEMRSARSSARARACASRVSARGSSEESQHKRVFAHLLFIREVDEEILHLTKQRVHCSWCCPS